ncbi:protein-glucosylgalactosylhydroxylysine glucosidase isoform 3-T3 [Hipposideros larvatus]
MLWTPVPSALTLGHGEEDGTWEFLTVVGGSQAEAQACLAEALRLQARGTLYTAHAQAWAQLWAGCGLDVVGPLALRQALRAALYYLLSALPHPGAPGYVCHGLSPGGLSNGSREECYWGHVFWDQDLWMFPNVLMFHPEAARALLEYRIRTLAGALDNARNLGYQGAKFAWESAGSGLEVCPEDIYGTQEIHINGAVALAFQLYYHSTQDLQLFQEAGGWDVVSAVAEFWCSRVEWSPGEEKYHLRGVMPPDEYHSGVNNSVYTNVLVQNSLRFAASLAEDLGRAVPQRWLAVADKIKVPFDLKQNFHPEFDGYEPAAPVPPSPPRRGGKAGRRRAPGVPCPLLPESSRSQEKPGDLRGCDIPPGPRHDLEHVCGGLDGAEGPQAGVGPPGKELRQHHRALQGQPVPASAHTCLPVGPLAGGSGSPAWGVTAGPGDSHLILGPSGSRGSGLRRGLCPGGVPALTTLPLQVWTENADGSGAVNFLTGMGGFLQAALFGFTGLRVTGAGVTFDPTCPAGVSGVCVSGISYQGSKLDFSFCEDSMTIEVRARAGPWAPPLEAELWPSQTRLPLSPGHKVSFPCSAGRIQRSLPQEAEAASSSPRTSS